MKKLCFTIPLLLFQYMILNAQQYVEVAVHDTVQLAADKFIYQVVAAPERLMHFEAMEPAERSPRDFMKREMEMREKQKEALAIIEKKLGSAGFEPMSPSMSDRMSIGAGHEVLRYAINGFDKLQAFEKIVRGETTYYANLLSVSSKNEKAAEDNLYMKLLNAARSRADQLAKLSGKKITGIISVSNAGNAERGMMRPYDRMGPMAIEHENNDRFSYPIAGTLLVRFAWE